MVSKAYTGPWEQFGGKANPYAKGSSILHMLRMKLGDEVFFRALGVYFQKHHFGLIETSDFRRIMEDESGESLDRFFRQWCFRPGVPELDMTITWDDSRHELVISGKQTQNIDGYNPAFDLSIPVWAAESSGDIRRLGTVEMEEREFEARFPMGAEPRIVEIDPSLSSLAKLTIHQPTQRWVEQAKRGHTWAARCQAARSLAEDKSSADAAGALA
jgi:aminopeptidase N